MLGVMEGVKRDFKDLGSMVRSFMSPVWGCGSRVETETPIVLLDMETVAVLARRWNCNHFSDWVSQCLLRRPLDRAIKEQAREAALQFLAHAAWF